jgi:hypothetical protein
VSEFDQNAHIVRHKLEDPVPILFWEPLDFTMAFALLGIGLVMGMWIIGMIGCFSVLIGSRYLRRGMKRGAVQHFLWSIGLPADNALKARFPPVWVNDLIE